MNKTIIEIDMSLIPDDVYVMIMEMGAEHIMYESGELPPRYPVPALFVDSASDLGWRWSQWLDTLAEGGLRV
jgi:hypothetical protein